MPRKKKKGMSILIVAKQNKTGIKHAVKLEKMLRRRTDSIHIDRSTAFRLRKIGTSISKFRGDLIITVGGDGTFLMTAHRANAPILPVKIEGKGFLCTCTFKELEKNIDRIFKGDYIFLERMRLKSSRVSGGISKYVQKIRHTRYPLSVNEIAFARKRPSKLLDIEVEIDGNKFQIVGDGVMFSTPSGSTAYSASAGGPIVDPSLSVINIIPLYPYYSKIKSMVVPADKKIRVKISGGECALVIDGHGGDYVKRDTEFIVEKAKPIRVVAFEPQDFYGRVKSILFES